MAVVSDFSDEDAVAADAAPVVAEPGGIEPGQPRRSLMDDPRVTRGITYVAAAVAFYFVQQWFWPAPIGVLVLGVVIGGLTAVIAFGISPIYRANRGINFAQADLGGAPAPLSTLLLVGLGRPHLLARGTVLPPRPVPRALVAVVIT